MRAPTHQLSVIICAYTLDRWVDLLDSVQSVLDQTVRPTELIVVIDHNDLLLTKAQRHFGAGHGPIAVSVLANTHGQGLSGARNTGVGAAHGVILAFLDDDACADSQWLELLAAEYSHEQVVGVGGSAYPQWPAGAGRPASLPAGPAAAHGELDWVVGCTYRGLPQQPAPVRNLMGCNMSIRASAFDRAGYFSEDLGRIGRTPLGCEETELCIRITQTVPGATFIFQPDARVTHRVSADRLTWAYLFSRCYAEGVSKAAVSRMVGPGAALSSERRYVSAVLPSAVARELAQVRPRHLLGAGAIIAGTAVTVTGYLRGKLSRYDPAITTDETRRSPKQAIPA